MRLSTVSGQTIEFNDSVSKRLVIENGQVMLDDQEILTKEMKIMQN